MADCQIWAVILLIAVSCVRIGMGLFVGVRGPTLLYLANNVESDVKTISYIFLGKSVGTVLGAVSSGFMKRWMISGFRHIYPLGIVAVLFGVCSLTIPQIRVLWLLILNITASNIMYGYLDSGLQALILQLFGEKGSRPFIQLFHFAFSVGAFLGPTIASPFLVMDEKKNDAKKRCPASGNITTSVEEHNLTTEIAQTNVVDEDIVQWIFYIIGVWTVAIGIIMLILGKLNIEVKIPAVANEGRDSEKRKEEPLKEVIFILLIVVLFYATNVSAENTFYYYLYPVAVCSDLEISGCRGFPKSQMCQEYTSSFLLLAALLEEGRCCH